MGALTKLFLYDKQGGKITEQQVASQDEKASWLSKQAVSMRREGETGWVVVEYEKEREEVL